MGEARREGHKLRRRWQPTVTRRPQRQPNVAGGSARTYSRKPPSVSRPSRRARLSRVPCDAAAPAQGATPASRCGPPTLNPEDLAHLDLVAWTKAKTLDGSSVSATISAQVHLAPPVALSTSTGPISSPYDRRPRTHPAHFRQATTAASTKSKLWRFEPKTSPVTLPIAVSGK